MLAESYEESDAGRAYRYYDLLARNVARMQVRGESDVANDYIQATAIAGKGRAEAKLGQYAVAAIQYHVAIGLMDRLLAAGPNADILFYRAIAQVQLARIDIELDDLAEARAFLTSALSVFGRAAPKEHPGTARAIGIAMIAQGDVERRARNARLACIDYHTAAKHWYAIIASHGMMRIDYVKDGSIERLRDGVAYCRLHGG